MQYVLYLASGLVVKLYDDITDSKTELSPFFLELVKVLLVAITTLTFFYSPSFALFSLMASLVYIVSDKALDNDFWKAVAVTPLLAVLLNLPYFISLSFIDICIHLAFVGFSCSVLLIEDAIFPEDISLKKYYSRIALCPLCLFFAYIFNSSNMTYLVPAWLHLGGYLAANLGFHATTILE